MSDLDTKLNRLRDRLCELGRLAIAYSGGVDSTLLLKVAVDTLGPENVLAITADSPVTTAAESACRGHGPEHGRATPDRASSEFDEPDSWPTHPIAATSAAMLLPVASLKREASSTWPTARTLTMPATTARLARCRGAGC